MTAAAIAASCGREDCWSPCHAGAGAGRYCAPARCYCYGCPGSLGPVERGRPATPDDLAARAAAGASAARELARLAREAGDLRDALLGEPTRSPSGRLSTFAGQVAA